MLVPRATSSVGNRLISIVTCGVFSFLLGIFATPIITPWAEKPAIHFGWIDDPLKPPKPKCGDNMPTGRGAQILFEVRRSDQECWQPELAPLLPSSTVELLVSYWNRSEVLQKDVTLRVGLPSGVELVPKTTRLANGTNPHGILTEDHVVHPAINVGAYRPGGAAYVILKVKISGPDAFECGSNQVSPLLQLWPNRTDELSDYLDLRVYKNC